MKDGFWNYFIPLVIGMLLAVGWMRRRRASEAKPAAAPAPAPVAAEPEVIDAPEPLTARLHRLENAFAPYGSNAAHPGELRDVAEFKEAVQLLADPAVPVETVLQYAQGANWALASAALAALPDHPDGAQGVEPMISHFDKLVPWSMYFALVYFVRVEPRPPVGAPAASAKEWWYENSFLPVFFRDYLVQRAALGDAAHFGPEIHAASASPLPVIRGFLARVAHPLAADLIGEIDAIQRMRLDRDFLTSLGRLWSDNKEPEFLIEPEAWRSALAATQALFGQTPVRSLLVCGDQLVGKTSFLRLLAARLAEDGWTLFEASGADLMAGQQWFGQLEGRIRQLVEELAVHKKIVWYVPDLLSIAQSGTHQGQSASILDQILPAITAGRLAIWSEATPTTAARLLQLRPTLRNLFEVVRVEPQDDAETLSLARSVIEGLTEDGVAMSPDCATVALDTARQYLGSSGFPGSALLLIKLTASRAEKDSGEIAPSAIIDTLSQLTGLPVSILDTRERIDLGEIRKFFSARVIGQDEAVATIVDRIAMLKAGLNDPGRPIGVFLFAGPTGTGKTELAKTTADYLFGSPDRLIRLDMSEFQTEDSLSKILGDGRGLGETDSLISRVRKQPFSVVLLDEFEKSHSRIWDLFLQVFDEGRLTDALGQAADFRHCLIILTTNLGATSHRSLGLGFVPTADVFGSEQIMRAISQTYRPEFQNRLDRVIVFRPLTRELMRGIPRKELERVLDRRGLKDRAWAVEWESSALDFLLEKGFSPEMGARPLKRAIDQHVIAPLAATIVEGRFPQGEQFLFVSSDGHAIQAEFVDPDSDAPVAGAPDPEAREQPAALAAIILAPTGSRSEYEELVGECQNIEQSLAAVDYQAIKDRLYEAMNDADFWTRPERFEILARLALIDRVAAAFDTATSLRTRLSRGSSRPGHYPVKLAGRLALQLHLIRHGIRDVTDGAPIEVALLVEPALDSAGDAATAREWCARVVAMYRAWASERHMQMAEVAGPTRDLPLLLIAGFGAHRVLARETGLHVLELGPGAGSITRITARVRLAVAPLGEVPAVKLRSTVLDALEHAPRASAVVRRYRSDPSPLVRNHDGSWRSGRLDAVLRGQFDLLADAPAS